jgi:hypothetical protein
MAAPLNFTFRLPDWARTFIEEKGRGVYLSDEDKARLAIEAAALNVRHKTGGPFGAAVFSAAGDKRCGSYPRIIRCSVRDVLRRDPLVRHSPADRLGGKERRRADRFR